MALVRWEPAFDGKWKLLVGRGKNPLEVATIWKNSEKQYTWSTWDRHGTGGENDVSETLELAQALASLCAIRQGFI